MRGGHPQQSSHFRTCLTLGVGNVIYGVMRVCGREFSSEVIARIEATVRGESSLSRRALSLRVCEWLQWRSPNGKPKEVSCRKALLELHRRRLIPLPAADKACFGRSCAEQPGDALIDAPELQCTLKELGEIVTIRLAISRFRKLLQIRHSSRLPTLNLILLASADASLPSLTS